MVARDVPGTHLNTNTVAYEGGKYNGLATNARRRENVPGTLLCSLGYYKVIIGMYCNDSSIL